MPSSLLYSLLTLLYTDLFLDFVFNFKGVIFLNSSNRYLNEVK